MSLPGNTPLLVRSGHGYAVEGSIAIGSALVFLAIFALILWLCIKGTIEYARLRNPTAGQTVALIVGWVFLPPIHLVNIFAGEDLKRPKRGKRASQTRKSSRAP